MQVIRDRDGNVIQRSRNLAGIRRYVRGGLTSTPFNLIKLLAIETLGTTGQGSLLILFEDGTTFQTDFACCDVLREFVRRWRNVYGAPLLVHGRESGTVSRDNPALS